MSNKNLIIILAVAIGAIALLGFKVLSLDSSTTGKGGNEAITLSTEPNPLRLGQATFMINLKDKEGKPVDNAEVFFDLNMTAMNMGTQQGNATAQGNGQYAATGKMTMKGPWRVRTKVTMPDGSVENKDFTVNVP